MGSGPSSNVSATLALPVVLAEPAGPFPVATGRFAGMAGAGGGGGADGGGGGVVGSGAEFGVGVAAGCDVPAGSGDGEEWVDRAAI
jgi:hypothetical protein